MLLSFSPNTLSPEILEKTLVGRKEILDQIEQELLEKITNGQTYQSLMIAPRGSGKTHLTTTLRYRLKNNADIEDKILIAYMNEDERGIANFSDFIRHILESFVKNREGEFEKINDLIFQVSSLDFKNQEAAFKKILLEYIGKKGLVILIENLNILFDDKTGMGSGGQRKLRSLMHEHNQFSLIATSQNLFHQIQDEKEPFYGFFNIRHLKKLDFQDTLKFIKIQAGLENDEALEKEAETAPFKGKVRAIYQLTGGSHRLLVIFFNFLKAEIKSDLSEVFRKTMNDLKPYYEQFLNSLSPMQQKVIRFLSKNHTPQMGKDISRFCFIASNTLSKQLSELEKKGYLNKNKVGKDNYYELKEPLMRICFEINDSKDGIVKLFVDFLSNYYTSEQLQKDYLEKRFHAIKHEDDLWRRKYIKETKLYRSALNMDIAERLDKVSFEECLDEKSLQSLIGSVLAKLKEENETSETSSLSLDKADFEKKNNISLEEFNSLVHKSIGLTLEEKQAIFENLPKLSSEQIGELIILSRNEKAEYLELMGVNLYALITRDSNQDIKSLAFNSAFLEELLAEPRFANDALVLSWISQVLQSEEKYEKAIEYLDRAININPKNPLLYYHKGDILGDIGKYKLALDSFTKAIKLNPDNADYHYAQGLAYYFLKDYKPALDSFAKAIKLNPDNADYHHSQGLAYYYLEDYKPALDSFTKAIKLNPENAQFYSEKGSVYGALEKYQLSIDVFEKSIKLNPENANYHFNQGLSYYYLNKYEFALNSFNRAVILNPNNSKFHYNQGLSYYHLEKYRLAFDSFTKAIKWNSGNSNYYFYQGLACYYLKDYKPALDSFGEAIKLNPDNSDYHYSQGLAYYYLNEDKLALDSFAKAIKLNSDEADYHYYQGAAHYSLKDYTPALDSFTKAINLNPENADYYNVLGISYLELDEPKRAIETFQKGLSINENDWYLSGSLIQAYLANSEFEKSKIQLEKVCALQKENKDSFYTVFEEDVLPPLLKNTDLKIVKEYLDYVLTTLQQKALLPELWKAFPKAVFNLLIHIEDYKEAHLDGLYELLKTEFSSFKEMTIPLLYLDIGIRYLKKGNKRAIYDFSTEERHIFEETILGKRKSI